MDEITELLRAHGEGDAAASRRLFELIYADLKRMAHKRLHAGGACELDTTSLVHEVFLRCSERSAMHASDRRAFFAYVARVMRSVIVDTVRERGAQKRGGGARSVTLTTGVNHEAFDSERVLSLDAALTTLERLAPSLHQIVELRYFAGLEVEAIAELLGMSSRTVAREWAKARAMLAKLIDEGDLA